MGTPRAITRPSDNAVVWKWENTDPFGANAPNEDPSSTGTNFKYNLRFPGQYYDQETGTHYNYFRDYDPATGRYVQSDPVGLLGGMNTYGYVGANPLISIDAFGLRSSCACNATSAQRPSDGSGVKMGGVIMKRCTYTCNCQFKECDEDVSRTVKDYTYDHPGASAVCYGQRNIGSTVKFSSFSFSDYVGDRYFNAKTPDRQFMDEVMRRMRAQSKCCK